MPSNAPQSLKNHTKFDPPFHYFLLPVFLINFSVAVTHLYHYPDLISGWLVVVALAALIAVLKIRTYSLKVQDRVIRLEERLRLSGILPGAQQPILDSLSEKQLVALRFASDAEAPTLAARAASQNLAPKDIKAAIQTWRPDYFRI